MWPGDPEHEKTTFAKSLSPSQIIQGQFKQGAQFGNGVPL